MVPFFAISSLGGSATKWLTGVLNTHPDIVCFHAIQYDPFSEEGGRKLTPQALCGGLRGLHEETGGAKCFGSIHSFIGAGMAPEVTRLGGGFSTIIRNPIDRIHSLFTHHLEIKLGYTQKTDNLYDELIAAGHIGPDTAEAAPAETDDPKYTEFENEFAGWCYRTMASDMESVLHCPKDAILQHERMVDDGAYLARKLGRILGPFAANIGDYAGDRFHKRENVHSRTQYGSASDIYFDWPPKFRRIFFQAMTHFGITDLLYIYGVFSYDMRGVAADFIGK